MATTWSSTPRRTRTAILTSANQINGIAEYVSGHNLNGFNDSAMLNQFAPGASRATSAQAQRGYFSISGDTGFSS